MRRSLTHAMTESSLTSTLSRGGSVDHEVAAVLTPPRQEGFEVPFLDDETEPGGRTFADGFTVPGSFRMRCVTDGQLASCPNGRNTTVWLSQSKLVYEYEGAAGDLPSLCLCEHLCNL